MTLTQIYLVVGGIGFVAGVLTVSLALTAALAWGSVAEEADRQRDYLDERAQ